MAEADCRPRARDRDAPLAGLGQVEGRAEVPEGALPGQPFQVVTPDGQQLLITAPEGCAPGTLVAYYYTPIGPQNLPTVTVVGMPVGGGAAIEPDMVAMGPDGVVLGTATEEQRQAWQDMESSKHGWMIYSLGWGLCVCCPFGCGVFAWYWIAAKHYCKSREERAHMRQERVVAQLALGTAIISSILGLIALVILLNTSDWEDLWPGDRRDRRHCQQDCGHELELYDFRSECDSFKGTCYGRRRRT